MKFNLNLAMLLVGLLLILGEVHGSRGTWKQCHRMNNIGIELVDTSDGHKTCMSWCSAVYKERGRCTQDYWTHNWYCECNY